MSFKFGLEGGNAKALWAFEGPGVKAQKNPFDYSGGFFAFWYLIHLLLLNAT
jgi:hypothetical protein